MPFPGLYSGHKRLSCYKSANGRKEIIVLGLLSHLVEISGAQLLNL